MKHQRAKLVIYNLTKKKKIETAQRSSVLPREFFREIKGSHFLVNSHRTCIKNQHLFSKKDGELKSSFELVLGCCLDRLRMSLRSFGAELSTFWL